MTSNEMVVVARLADHYEKNGIGIGQDPLDVAEHDFRKFKREAPELWRRLYNSKLSDRAIGDWIYDFIKRWQLSRMSFKNFAADELERSR